MDDISVIGKILYGLLGFCGLALSVGIWYDTILDWWDLEFTDKMTGVVIGLLSTMFTILMVFFVIKP